MALCFLEPAEAIRVVFDSVGLAARERIWAELIRAWADQVPEDELELLYSQAVSSLDGDDLALLAAWHASLSVGTPVASRDFLVAAFPALGRHRREALRLAAGFRGDGPVRSGARGEVTLSAVLCGLETARMRDLAARAVEIYVEDRLGSLN